MQVGQPCHAGGRSGQYCKCVQPLMQVCSASVTGVSSQCCRCVQPVLQVCPANVAGVSSQCCRCVQQIMEVGSASAACVSSQCCRCVQLVLREWSTIGAGVSPDEGVCPASDVGVPSQRSWQVRPVMQVCSVSVAIVSSQPVLEVQQCCLSSQ